MRWLVFPPPLIRSGECVQCGGYYDALYVYTASDGQQVRACTEEHLTAFMSEATGIDFAGVITPEERDAMADRQRQAA